MIHVSELNIFPVKSFQGMSVQNCNVEDFGPSWDRRFMLINEQNRFVTQRQLPVMSQFSAVLTEQTLQINSPKDSITIELKNLESLTESAEVTIWQDVVEAKLLTDEINQWLSNQLNHNVRMCFIPSNVLRQVDLAYANPGDKTGFSDGFPFLIISQASLDFLSDKVGYELTTNRFRPNVVVSGCEAFAEDTWKAIEINGIQFDIVKPCSRCVIPTLNPVNSEKQPEVMQAMLKYRKQDNAVYVGQNMIHRGLGSISVGQEVKILS